MLNSNYYNSDCHFNKELALEESKEFKKIISEQYNFKNSIFGIIAREQIKLNPLKFIRTDDVDEFEKIVSNNLNNYFCEIQRTSDPSLIDIDIKSLIP